MTTTELIELLKKYEKGGVTKRPRELKFHITMGKEKLFIPSSDIRFISCGDGLVTDLTLEIFTIAKLEREKIDESTEI